MSDLNAIADRLFPSSVPSTAGVAAAPVVESSTAAEPAAQTDPAKPTEAAQAPAETPAAAVELPDAIRELRDDPLRRLFSPQGTYAGVQLEAAMQNAALDPAIKTAVAAEYREWFADMGASPHDAQEIVDAASRFSAEPMTPERDATNANDAIGALNREFGNDAASALKAAQEMVLRDPRLARVLDESRLGNDPAIVVKLAHLARSQRARG